jgi:hypothetical protein
MSTLGKAIRESEFYKNLDSFNAVGIAEGFVESDSDGEIQAAWQYLHDKRIAYSLQGWFGRTCQSLIEEGIIEK